MRERVNIVSGKIVIHTAPGAGTRIGVRVRLDAFRLDTPVRHRPADRLTMDARRCEAVSRGRVGADSRLSTELRVPSRARWMAGSRSVPMWRLIT